MTVARDPVQLTTPAGARQVVGRRLSLPALPGFGQKWLLVPEAQEGICLGLAQPRDVLPPGRHRVLRWWDRLVGDVAAVQVGLVASRGFSLTVRGGPVLGAGAALVDWRLTLALRIMDPAQFFAQEVVPAGEVTLAGLAVRLADLVAEHDLASGWLEQYQTSGAGPGRLPPEMESSLRRTLERPLSFSGLAVEAIEAFEVRPVADRLTRQRRLDEFALKVNALVLEAETSRQQTALEWQGRLQTLLAELGRPGEIDVQALAAQLAERPAGPVALGQFIRPSAPADKEAAAHGSLGERLRRLWGRSPAIALNPSRRSAPRWWWVPAALKSIIVALFGLTLVVLALRLGASAPPFERLIGTAEILLIAVPLIWGAVVGLVRAQNNISEQAWSEHGQTHLDVLSHGNRALADRLVRAQIGADLNYVAQAVSEARRSAYAAGRRDASLKLKALEARVEHTANQAGGGGGPAPYLAAAKVSPSEFDQMLDLDEDLLVQASHLTPLAKQLLKLALAGAVTEAAGQNLDQALLEFDHAWATRARFLQAPVNPPG